MCGCESCEIALRLALEALARPRATPTRRVGQHLDRHVALEPRVPRPVDLAHPARAERRDDLVGTEASSRRRGMSARGYNRGSAASGARLRLKHPG